MKALWIGSLLWYFDDIGYVLEPKLAGEVSASAFEQSLIEGLEHLGNEIEILSDYGTRKGKRMCWSHNCKAKDVFVPGIKTKYLRLVYKSFKLKKEIKKRIKAISNTDFVFIYSTHTPYFSAAKLIRKINPNVRIVLICPDLSEYMDPDIGKKPIKRFLRFIETKYVHSVVSIFDGVIWFAERMKEILKMNCPSILLEGICSSTNINLTDEAKKENYCVYAGSLNENFGLQNLIKGFIDSKIDSKLLLFGSGELEKYICEVSKTNPNIIYGGMIERGKLFEYEKKAKLLLNFRDPNESFTKYSFPSKMLEYMSSGTPVLTTWLDGFPLEYKDYLIYIENNSAECIKNKLIDVFARNPKELEDFGKRARDFVLTKKNKYYQAERVNDFLMNEVTVIKKHRGIIQ